MGEFLDSTDDPEVLQARLEMLGKALLDVLVAAKMVRKDIVGMSGPELLLAAEDFVRSVNETDNDVERNYLLTADTPVQRSDGRYYIPVSKVGAERPPILRVSTDIFEGDMDDKVNRAIEFACDLTARWNRGPC